MKWKLILACSGMNWGANRLKKVKRRLIESLKHRKIKYRKIQKPKVSEKIHKSIRSEVKIQKES